MSELPMAALRSFQSPTSCDNTRITSRTFT
jgi:hypothetical protein